MGARSALMRTVADVDYTSRCEQMTVTGGGGSASRNRTYLCRAARRRRCPRTANAHEVAWPIGWHVWNDGSRIRSRSSSGSPNGEPPYRQTGKVEPRQRLEGTRAAGRHASALDDPETGRPADAPPAALLYGMSMATGGPAHGALHGFAGLASPWRGCGVQSSSAIAMSERSLSCTSIESSA